MSTTTSTTGSIAVDVIADTLSAPRIIVVRQDIYKGAVLLGTTYRNISLTSTYVTPIPAITFNGVKTTFTTQQAPTPFVSSTNSTTLTFVNSTIPGVEWDNSLLTVTVT
jgi:hypothetical protein